jgi:hypothetical protein
MSGGVGRGLLRIRVAPRVILETTKFWGTDNGGPTMFVVLGM